MVVMDEASQCSTAVSLVPVLRGRSLLLVGDPQQLSPVVVLDPRDNEILRRKYAVTDEYEIDPAEARNDILAFLTNLKNSNLLAE